MPDPFTDEDRERLRFMADTYICREGDDDALVRALAYIDYMEEALEDEWLCNHDDRCSNLHECASFGHERECHHPRPDGGRSRLGSPDASRSKLSG